MLKQLTSILIAAYNIKDYDLRPLQALNLPSSFMEVINDQISMSSTQPETESVANMFHKEAAKMKL